MLVLRALLLCWTVPGAAGEGRLPQHAIEMNAIVGEELRRLYATLAKVEEEPSSMEVDQRADDAEGDTLVAVSVLLSDSFWLFNSIMPFPSMWSHFFSIFEMEGDSDTDV
ncbi:hypothetical protein STCU_10530 [Strigomonas culicis]|uniref:Uncharacterized protein n=1 Tax=Strigomonas culicis TaxID=28005 RepID=S9V3Z5_9TRYP|nr:hypothetical protein STCU_10530 [Strigomonas culicis]|eukprot:EPY17570.1 hypothetical protein STCU_10530 [Strigomonas culicis]